MRFGRVLALAGMVAAVYGGGAVATTGAGDGAWAEEASSSQSQGHTVMVPNVTLSGSPTQGRAPWAPPVYGEMQQQVIGRSVEGRDIVAYTGGDGARVVVVIGGLHTGAEAMTVRLLEVMLHRIASGLLTVPEGLRLVVVPLANPDGWVHDTRTNARGVDLNRNWPTPDWSRDAVAGDADVSGGPFALSEPEVAALYSFLLGANPELVISYHGLAAITEANSTGAAEEFGALYAAAAGYAHIDEWIAYPVTGELIGALAKVRIPAFDVELATGEPDDMARNLAALQVVFDHLAAGD